MSERTGADAPFAEHRHRRATQQDVAERAGVSRALVSMVVRGTGAVREDKRAAVLKAIDELGYRADPAGRALAGGDPQLIGVVMGTLVNPNYGGIVHAVVQEAARHGFRTLLESSALELEREYEAVESLLDLRVQGLVLVAPLADDDCVGSLRDRIPAVVVGRDTGHIGIDCVGVDSTSAARGATEHLLGRGHRHIAYVDAEQEAGSPASQARLRGYEEAMAAADRTASVHTVATPFQIDVPELDAVLAADPAPTAIFAHDDFMALAVAKALEMRGLRVPDDVAVVGFGDSIVRGARADITSVELPLADCGRIAFDLLRKRMADPHRPCEEHGLPTRLVVRRTG